MTWVYRSVSVDLWTTCHEYMSDCDLCRVRTMGIEHLDDVYEELFLYGLIRKNTLRDHVEALYPYLREEARKNRLIDYDDAKDHLGTSRRYLGRVLGAINECEHRKDNPLLTAIVVRDTKIDGERRPSMGFFTWPCVRDRQPDCWSHPDHDGSPSEKQLKYWKEERDRVWEAWSDE